MQAEITRKDEQKYLKFKVSENPIFAKTVSAKSVRVGNRCLTNHNKLLWQYPEATGVKTGYTKASGRILVSSAKRNGRSLVAVTINDPNDWQDHKKLFDYGFQDPDFEAAFDPQIQRPPRGTGGDRPLVGGYQYFESARDAVAGAR